MSIGTITKIETQKKNNERVNIFVNGEYLFSCSTELVYVHSIAKGKTVEVEYLRDITEEDNYIKGKNTALKYLEKSFRTEKEILDKLAKFEYSEKVLSRILEFLCSYGFVDDNRYVEMYVRDKILSRGKDKIKFELLKKGIREDIILEKLGELDSSTERERAVILGEKKLKTLLKSEGSKLKLQKKLQDFLVRKGYNYEITSSVTRELIDNLNLCNENLDVETSKKNSFSKDIREEFNEEEYMDNLYSIALKRYELLCKREDDNRKLQKKLHDFLLRKGYKYDEIKTVLREITSRELE